jgi:hypothetical protein
VEPYELSSLIEEHRMRRISDAEFSEAIRECSDEELVKLAAVVRSQSHLLRAEQDQLRMSSDATGAEFIKTEIALGITFSEIAMTSASHDDKYKRNHLNAQAAYAVALEFRDRLHLTETDELQIDRSLAVLQSRLARLGTSGLT